MHGAARPAKEEISANKLGAQAEIHRHLAVIHVKAERTILVHGIFHNEAVVSAITATRQIRAGGWQQGRKLAPSGSGTTTQASPTHAAGVRSSPSRHIHLEGVEVLDQPRWRDFRIAERTGRVNSRIQALGANLNSEQGLCQAADSFSGDTLEDIVETNVVEHASKVLQRATAADELGESSRSVAAFASSADRQMLHEEALESEVTTGTL